MSYVKQQIYLNKPSDSSVSFESVADAEYIAYLKNKVDKIYEELGYPNLGLSSAEMAKVAAILVTPTMLDYSLQSEFFQGFIIGCLAEKLISEGGAYEEEDSFY